MARSAAVPGSHCFLRSGGVVPEGPFYRRCFSLRHACVVARGSQSSARTYAAGVSPRPTLPASNSGRSGGRSGDGGGCGGGGGGGGCR